MIFEEKKITLKNGVNAVLKTPEIEDAEALLNNAIQTTAETDFFSRYPEEWDLSIDQEKEWVKQMRDSSDSLVITCYINGKAVGSCDIRFNSELKTAHRALVGIAILKDYWNIGIGSAMFSELINEARKRSIEFMELEFVEGNERGKALYEKFGFEVVSVKPRVCKLKDGTYQNLVYMQKYL